MLICQGVKTKDNLVYLLRSGGISTETSCGTYCIDSKSETNLLLAENVYKINGVAPCIRI